MLYFKTLTIRSVRGERGGERSYLLLFLCDLCSKFALTAGAPLRKKEGEKENRQTAQPFYTKIRMSLVSSARQRIIKGKKKERGGKKKHLGPILMPTTGLP